MKVWQKSVFLRAAIFSKRFKTILFEIWYDKFKAYTHDLWNSQVRNFYFVWDINRPGVSWPVHHGHRLCGEKYALFVPYTIAQKLFFIEISCCWKCVWLWEEPLDCELAPFHPASLAKSRDEMFSFKVRNTYRSRHYWAAFPVMSHITIVNI